MSQFVFQKLIFAALAIGCLATVSFGQEKLVEQIRKLHDKDSDGTILKSEASGALKANFERIDKDKDGALDQAELVALANWLQGNRSENHTQSDPKPDSTSGEPVKVKRITDIAYRKGNKAWKLDLVLPTPDPASKSTALRPALVFVHGGAWRVGDKGDGIWKSYPIHFAKKGYVCISVNYRFTDEAPFPACIEDCKCAVRWLRANAKKYKVDPSRIGAYGNSAGAHLVSLLGLVDKNKKLEGEGPYQEFSSLVQAVVPSATPSDFINWNTENFGRKGKLLAGDSETLDSRAQMASPVFHANAKAPPFLIFHGTNDRLVPVSQGRGLARALKKAGAKNVTLKIYEGGSHGVFRQNERETLPMMESFFAEHLKEKTSSK